MPEELRNLGDLYIKQEFRVHLDQSSEDQMVKFMKAWEDYKTQLEGMKMDTRKDIKESFSDPSMDEMIKDKLTQEQQDTLGEFKQIIYDNEKYKKYNK